MTGRMPRFTLPEGRTLQVYVAGVTAAGAGAIAAGRILGGAAADPWLLIALVLAGAASERFKVGLFGDSHVSLGAVACMAAGLLGGPGAVALVAPPVALAANLGGRLPLYKTCFNVAAYTLASMAFLATVTAFDLARMPSGWPEVVLPATAGALAYFAANVALVAGAISLASGDGLARVVRAHYLWLLPHYLPLGALSAGVATGYQSAGLWAIALFVAPLCGAQAALWQYAALRSRLERAARLEDEVGAPPAADGQRTSGLSAA